MYLSLYLFLFSNEFAVLADAIRGTRTRIASHGIANARWKSAANVGTHPLAAAAKRKNAVVVVDAWEKCTAKRMVEMRYRNVRSSKHIS